MISITDLFSRSKVPKTTTQWIKKHDLRVVPVHSGEDVLRLSGKILDADFKLACGPSTKPYIDGSLVLRAHIHVPLHDRISMAVLSRTLREQLQDTLYSVDNDDVQTRVAAPEEMAGSDMQLLAVMREVRIEHTDFRKGYSLVCNRPKWARVWLDETLARLITTAGGSKGVQVPMVIMLRGNSLWLYWSIKKVSVEYLRQGRDLLQLALERIYIADRDAPSTMREDDSDFVV